MGITLRNVDKSRGRNAALGIPIQWVIWNPAVAAANAVRSAYTIGGASSGVVSTGFTNPDVPRAISTTTTNLSSNTATVVVGGTDFWGNKISESFYHSANGTVSGNKAFRTVTSMTWSLTGALGGGTQAVAINTLDKLGLPVKIRVSGDIVSSKEGEIEGGSGAAVDALAADAGTVAIGADYWTYDPAITLNGAKDIVLEIISTYGEQSW